MAQDSGRLPLLDGLRGLGALLVLVSHVGFWTGATRSGVWGAALARGDAGVAIFFALSAFLLLRPVVTGSSGPLRTYAVRRAARILPAYWLALAGVLIAAAVLGPVSGSAGTGGASSVLAHVLILQGFTGHTHESFTQTWSLTTEVTFYVAVPALLALAARVRVASGRLVTAGLVGCCLLGALVQGLAAARGLDVLAVSLVGHLAWFTAGAAVLAWRSGRWRTATGPLSRGLKALGDRPAEALLVATLVGAVALTDAAGPRDLAAPTVGQAVTKELLYAAFAFLLVLAATAPSAPGSASAAVAAAPFTRWVGDISYGVFLWHVLVLQVLYRVVGLELFTGRFLAVLTVVVLLSVLMAELSRRLLERPALAWAHRRVPTPQPP